MEEIVIKELEGKLTTLGVARDQLEDAVVAVEDAEYPYRFAIGLIEHAMEYDLDIIQAKEKLATIKQVEEDAAKMVTYSAVPAWEEGFTNGRKEWRHGSWEIRLRTTLTSTVTDIEDFIAHLERIGATGALIKKLTLNRKATTDLDSAIGPLSGLEIEEKITCSARRVK